MTEETIKNKIKRSFGENFPIAVRKNSRLIIIIAIIFMVSIFLALYANQIGTNPINQAVKTQTEPFRRRLTQEAQIERTTLGWIGFYLRNNLVSAIEIIGLGIVFGIFSLYALLLNGLLIGYVLSLAEYSLMETLALLLPHGIFELTGYVLAITCGIQLGLGSIKSLIKQKTKPLKKAGKKITDLLPVIIILIIIAALIEGLLGNYQQTILNSQLIQTTLIITSLAYMTILILWMSGKLTKTDVR